ncbi:putative membrane protein YfcA [Parabacteroides sp. PF5-5]|uniref:sulfite exporter TauE/SafE family protein n=1 Tax=unclassified Parabacteroides TaxID=2649774 RepID=UPI0024734383|nr:MULTISPECIES: sulfite exporter TauE/SafE family protein [unclassified Parabacteroides]MDH6305054.1 putative membrane protein YfcA [Parabacteroides sp. PH5-39]MDH6315861.1 putative membrane protein YfcA [Parabacteroides sp. PF5-13]MDH6319518.1 putative membrane protein YfcA [Parabacteroides sp. PH5-13]MDH6323249.1 putative membrane protein YfcA [Parabacteroides sp. PH5-8]MDH6327243.1 putative membrane protein YfcA [Parabacteroides sp. PH5-41]
MSDLSLWMNTPYDWVLLFGCALLIGMSKTGIQGITLLAIPLMAVNFGAKASTGLILPMLCFSDLIAVFYYRRTAEWKYIFKLLPAAVAGFFLAILVDKLIPADEFKRLMAICIFLGLAVMFWSEKKGKDSKVFTTWWYAPLFGLMGGFTTMIGNAAGPVMSVYLLSMRLPKYSFVGTSAWFFLLVNYLKLPLQIFVWENISLETITLNAITIPFMIIGAIIGIYFVKKIPEKTYRTFIIVVTILSTLMLLF